MARQNNGAGNGFQIRCDDGSVSGKSAQSIRYGADGVTVFQKQIDDAVPA
jgi:hypothetical protein